MLFISGEPGTEGAGCCTRRLLPALPVAGSGGALDNGRPLATGRREADAKKTSWEKEVVGRVLYTLVRQPAQPPAF